MDNNSSKQSPFYEVDKEGWIDETDNFFLIHDAFPVTDFHTLIISKAGKSDFFELNKDEQADLGKAINLAKKHIETHGQPDGYTIGMNCGEAAGQTVFHFHCHVIPRYRGDVENPTGGVRNVIPGKGDYTKKA